MAKEIKGSSQSSKESLPGVSRDSAGTNAPITIDFDRTFGEIHTSATHMRDNVLRLQTHIIDKDELYRVAGQLRFISAILNGREHDRGCEEAKHSQNCEPPTREGEDEYTAYTEQVWSLVNDTYPLLTAAAELNKIPLPDYQLLWRTHRYRLDRDRQERLAGDYKGRLAMSTDECSCKKVSPFLYDAQNYQSFNALFQNLGLSIIRSWYRLLHRIPPASTLRTPRLRITKAGEYGSCVHYVAVSYRWLTRKETNSHTVGAYSIESESLERTRSIAPNKVLDRAIRFATHCDVPFVWIDQECIRQTVKEEQEMGIQSMDLVYQRAVVSIGLLEFTITTQKEMDTLDRVLCLDDLTAEQFVESVTLFERLMSDEWMHRAWIYQELATSGPRMLLLLKCDPNLRRAFRERLSSPRRSIGLSGEYDIILSELMQAIEYLEHWAVFNGYSLPTKLKARLANVSRSVPATISEDQPVKLIGHFGEGFTNRPERGKHDATYRPLISITGALKGLEGRLNSRIPDRIAIMGNLCAYEKRINTQTIQLAGRTTNRSVSMSTVAYVLALLNGDFSLVYALNNTASGPSSQGFQWFPLSRSIKADIFDAPSCVNNLSYQMNKCVLSMEGVRTEGRIWAVTEKIDLYFLFWRGGGKSLSMDEYRERYSSVLDSNNNFVAPDENQELPDAVEKLSIWMTLKVIRHLIELEDRRPELEDRKHEIGLAEAMFDWFRSFCTINVTEREQLVAEDITFDDLKKADSLPPESFQLQGSGIDCYWILRRAFSPSRSLWAGRIAGSRSHTPLTAIFDVDRAGHVFTPASDSFKFAKVRQGAVSMAVRKQGVSSYDQCDILSCRQLVRGVWGKVGVNKSCSLAWDADANCDSISETSSAEISGILDIPKTPKIPDIHVKETLSTQCWKVSSSLLAFIRQWASKIAKAVSSRFQIPIQHTIENKEVMLDLPRLDFYPLILPQKDSVAGGNGYPPVFAVCTICSTSVDQIDFLQCQPCGITMCSPCHSKGLGCARRHRMSEFFLQPGEVRKARPAKGTMIDCVNFTHIDAFRNLLQRESIEYVDALHSKRYTTALHGAAMLFTSEYTVALLEAGADRFATDSNGMTALHLAARGGRFWNVKVLLTKESSSLATLKDKDGMLPLHYACRGAHLPVVKAICDIHRSSPDQDLRDKKNLTPYMYALQHSESDSVYQDLCQYLESIGEAHIAVPDLVQLHESPTGNFYAESQATEVTTFTQHSPDTPYLAVSIPGKVERLVFHTWSHDQAHGGEPGCRGTYEGSHTWFEVGKVTSSDEVSPRLVVQRNMVASGVMRHHINYWSQDDSSLSKERLDFLRSLAAGDTIGVYAKALYPGWTNFVERVKVEVVQAVSLGPEQCPQPPSKERASLEPVRESETKGVHGKSSDHERLS